MRIAMITIGFLLNVGASMLLDATWHPPRLNSRCYGGEAWGHSDYGFTAWTCRAFGCGLIVASFFREKR